MTHNKKGVIVLRIGLSGTGRVGRLILRQAFTEMSDNVEIATVNTTTSLTTLAHLLQYDSVHGSWDAQIRVENNRLIINGKEVNVVSERNPAALPWREHNVQLVIDATGRFTDRSAMAQHLAAGAERVLLTSPGNNVDLTIVMGVNEDRYDPDRHRLLSAASCTTNCAAPILLILDEAFGVKSGWLTSVHAYTNDQKHLDNPHSDLRRARSCTRSIIPTSTGVSKSLVDVLPRLAPHMKGISVRVPTQNVSLLDLQLDLKQAVTVPQVKTAFQTAINGKIGAYVGYNELPLVSVDYIGNDKSAVVDGLSMMTNGHQLKVLAWYDNEWAYARRVLDCAEWVAARTTSNHEGGQPCTAMTM